MKSDILDTLERWLENGGRTFGQIAITRSGDGWELRHTADAGAQTLETFRNWEDARTIATLDDGGAFRPLKTTQNLRRGWRLLLATPSDLRRALDYLYPAMAAIACAHERGELHPVPLRDTLARQTGMYRITQKITNDQAQAMIGTTCAGCLKTNLWPLDATQPLTALPAWKLTPASGKSFPLLCHEACNLLVAEARKVVKGAA